MVCIVPSGTALTTVTSPYITNRSFRVAQFSVPKEEAGGVFEASNDSHARKMNFMICGLESTEIK
jgi:hypothetical protein